MSLLAKHLWSDLSKLQLGRYAEYCAKMEFTRYGFDVYEPEVDERGIDFVIRKSEGKYYEMQVKSKRDLAYVYFPKEKFQLSKNLYAVIVLFLENSEPPQLYLIPSTKWRHPNSLFKSRNYVGRKSKPEWGLELNKRNYAMLKSFAFDRIVKSI
jgi:hypothetical protein